jgi:hypothetical protein
MKGLSTHDPKKKKKQPTHLSSLRHRRLCLQGAQGLKLFLDILAQEVYLEGRGNR